MRAGLLGGQLGECGLELADQAGHAGSAIDLESQVEGAYVDLSRLGRFHRCLSRLAKHGHNLVAALVVQRYLSRCLSAQTTGVGGSWRAPHKSHDWPVTASGQK